MITDVRNREIGERIIEVVLTEPGLTKLSKKETYDSRFYFCHEFFADRRSLTCSLPAFLSRKVNGNYFGWQKIDLSEIDWNQYRPEGQMTDVEGPTAEGVDRYAISEAGIFDRHVASDIWIRFVQDESAFLSKFDEAGRMSSNIRRAILRLMGFEYCGRRFFSTEERDPFGLPVSFGDIGFLRPRGGSYGYCQGLTPANSGLLVKYQSINMGFLRKIKDNPILIQHWGQGDSGLDEIWLWGYKEFDLFPCDSPEWEEMRENIRVQIRALADKYPLLRRICCDSK